MIKYVRCQIGGEKMSGLAKIICIKKCDYCNNDVEIRHKGRLNRNHIFCSKSCEGNFKKLQNLNIECPVCGIRFHLKPSQVNKSKVHYCSRNCQNIAKSIYMKGEGNHQYGLKGNKNSSWKIDEKTTYYGYRKIRCLNHPFKDCDGFVFEHRLLAEKYLLIDEYTIIINGKRYLSPEFVVHHIDENKLNNNINNLKIMTPQSHMKLHKNYKK
ncbi:hypothetical protein FC831_10570 [Clostridium botulinum]|nr:hypothetical protein [Clostridium botulinum]